MKKGLVELQEAEAVFSRSNGRHDGIGFATLSDDPFTFMDVDHCRGAKGELTSEALDICGTLATYTEYGHATYVMIVRGRKLDGFA
jgi:primase-polymerase (primpol)-like protein